MEARPWRRAAYSPEYNLWLFPWAAHGGTMDLPRGFRMFTCLAEEALMKWVILGLLALMGL
jgi:hypothetical protein